jgi:FAD/FMN-containing dehydrogenase
MNLHQTHRLTGQVYGPGDDGYDERRRALNPAIEHRPLAVVEALRAADVRAAVEAARRQNLPIAVQATGHGTHAAIDGGILLRTGGMAAVMVDPERRTARVGPGARWAQVLAAAAPFGLAPLSGSAPSVGVTGYTLGGGMGWLARRYGLAADSVVRADLVTADGRLVTATADRNPDLFWAMRGGGGNFGVVTLLEFRLYPVSSVFAGSAYFPAAGAGEFLARYRGWAADAPDAMSTAVVLRTMPDADDVPPVLRGRRVLMLKAMYAGPADAARRVLAPLWSAAGPALHDDLRPMAYADAAMGGTAARYLDFFPDLTDPVLDVLVGLRSTVEIRHWGGAIASTGIDAGPAGHRGAPFSVIVDEAVPGLPETLRPHAIGGSFLNFLGDTRRTASAYTPENHRRLRLVKAAYDPENVFHVGHNIPPAAAAASPRAS